jgi:ATP-dependent exoDNAse (exonuclease V) beta subunit
VLISHHEQRLWFEQNPEPDTPRPAYRITPSDGATALLAEGTARIGRIQRLKRRMDFSAPRGVTWDAIGTALHAFLAADVEALPETGRTELAQRILTGATLAGAFEVDALLAASDALRQFASQHWPHAAWHREVPIRVPLDTPGGRRCIQGTIDLLLETPAGVVVIDHKSFPGRSTDWPERAVTYAPQLFTYAHALELLGKNVVGCFVHFTIGGGMVELRRAAPGEAANDVGSIAVGRGEG